MTKTQFKKKTKEIIKQLNIIEECERLFNSGAVDTKSYDNNWRLPRIILCVALENISNRERLDRDEREINNLKCF